MAALVTTTTTTLPHPKLFSLSSSLKPLISNFNPTISSNPQFSSSLQLTHRCLLPLRPCSALQDIAVEEEKDEASAEETLEGEGEEGDEDEKRRKLFVVNLPWSFSASDIEKLFGECGTVKDVEIIKQKNGKSRGFAFITMATGDEARAVFEKFDSFEVMGRIIRVEFAKSFRKPSPPPPPGTPTTDGRYKIYASNLAWKVRANNLRELFSEKFKPISARVVFDSPSGRSSGYGFVGFATMEEAEAAVSDLDGKELMGRPLRLKLSQKTADESGDEPEAADDTEQQPEQS